MVERVVELRGVSVIRAGTAILDSVDWRVGAGERWAIVGPNGSGKTTLLQLVSTYLWPSRGAVTILGSEIGAVDSRELRRRIGYASAALAAAIDDSLTPLDVVMTARHAALAPWWHEFDDADRDRALDLLGRLGCDALANRTFGTLSSGERQRVQIARTLMADPELLLLDEPAVGLDLGAREALTARLDRLVADPALAAVILVTHHVEEIPPGVDHALVMRAGRVVAAGPIESTLTGSVLSEAFGLPLVVDRRDGRFRAWGRATAE
ncbi:MAG TPA: ATP-binding cassette domain-containing protein [Candidatus Saccharimonadales bacterium]|nr:ATP-binding cassette domain-containing protein [Candidatus Saccharimonadales bacterium]